MPEMPPDTPAPPPSGTEGLPEAGSATTAEPLAGEPGPYRVHLDTFEGPLDLLLHLITKNEVDIYDIPIAVITEQYLEYISIMKSLNINVAGEFLVMASTLIYIKSQMLLPAPETEGEEEGPDPREELIQRLLEYQQFKEIAMELRERALLGRDVFTRPGSEIELDFDPGLEEVSLFQLVAAFDKVLKAAQIEHIHEVDEIGRASCRERV